MRLELRVLDLDRENERNPHEGIEWSTEKYRGDWMSSSRIELDVKAYKTFPQTIEDTALKEV